MQITLASIQFLFRCSINHECLKLNNFEILKTIFYCYILGATIMMIIQNTFVEKNSIICTKRTQFNRKSGAVVPLHIELSSVCEGQLRQTTTDPHFYTINLNNNYYHNED